MKTRRQVLGQNFLHHKPTIAKIMAQVECGLKAHPSLALLEIGPGQMALTQDLQQFAQEKNLPLFVIERDQNLRPKLEPHLQNLMFFDAATDKMDDFFRERAAQNQVPLFLVSNLPYSAASQILAKCVEFSGYLSAAIVMVQKEMAERMVAEPRTKERGSFSILIQSCFEAEILFHVGPGAFSPPPKVMSTVVKLMPKKNPLLAQVPDRKEFETFCKQLFSQRRKMLRGQLKQDEAFFARFELQGTERPEELSVDTILKIFLAL